jgi:lipopolysaccharide transport system ATP-binding protein
MVAVIGGVAMNYAVAIEGLAKEYRLGTRLRGEYQTIRESVSRSAGSLWTGLKSLSRSKQNLRASEPSSTTGSFWALQNVSFQIQTGQVIGVVGRNGAGKSTLLKILSRITDPTRGRIELRGRVSSLLEVGTGFHHELTGRENIYLNGSILGMTRHEIRKKFNAIVEFAEVERFLDTPVKRYSSGMYVRLAFAVAAHLEPEILIVDEVLAVGDGSFQRKCLGKMGEVSRSGRTVILVSHNMATVLNLCEKLAVLDKGQLLYFGETRQGIANYVHQSKPSIEAEVQLENHSNRRSGCEPILGMARIMDGNGLITNQLLCGDPTTIELELATRCPDSAYHFAVGFEDETGRRLMTTATYLSDSMANPCKGARRVRCRIDSLSLAPGRYALSFNAGPVESLWKDFIDQAAWIEVLPADFYGNGRTPKAEWGDFLARSQWTIQPATAGNS